MGIEKRIGRIEEKIKAREDKIEELMRASMEDREKLKELYVKRDIAVNGKSDRTLSKKKKTGAAV